MLELRPQLAHVDVNRAIAHAQLAPPDCPAELLAADDPARVPNQRDEQLELSDRQCEHLTPGSYEALVGGDLEIVDSDRVTVIAEVGHR